MAPTVYRTLNLRVVIFPKDHHPAHVHVFGPDQEAKFTLEPLDCYYSRGFSRKALKEIEEYLRGKTDQLMEVWHDYQK